MPTRFDLLATGGWTDDQGAAPGTADRRRDPGRRRQDPRRRGLRRDLSRVARLQRGGGARPGARDRGLPALQPPLRRHPPASLEVHAPPRPSRDHPARREQVRARRPPGCGDLSARRRGLAHRRRLRRRALQGDPALRAGRPEPGWRHAVREHVRGVRGAAAAPQEQARRTQGRLHLRRPAEGDGAAQRRGPRLGSRPASHHSHSSRDRAQGALLRPRQNSRDRGPRGGGERRADRRADRPDDPARGRVPPPVAQGGHRHLGQPVLVSQGRGRLPPEEDRVHWRVSIKERQP